jgi:hypothetical protein
MKAVHLLLAAFVFGTIGAANLFSQTTMTTPSQLQIKRIDKDFDVKDLDSRVWQKAKSVKIAQYWSGKAAPNGRHFSARLLWSDNALYVRFEANRDEPLVVSDKPDLSKKTLKLWDRDVCEIFIAPDKLQRNKYFEFEIAPTGEWIDLGIEVTPKERLTDWDYKSNMISAARIDKDKVVMAIKIQFASLGKTPKVGDVWLGNLFRCVGKDPTRGYLAWQPTKTKDPAFHVPEAFGEFKFVK